MQCNGEGYNIINCCFDFQYRPLDCDRLLAQILYQNFKLKYHEPCFYNKNINTYNEFFSILSIKYDWT